LPRLAWEIVTGNAAEEVETSYIAKRGRTSKGIRGGSGRVEKDASTV